MAKQWQNNGIYNGWNNGSETDQSVKGQNIDKSYTFDVMTKQRAKFLSYYRFSKRVKYGHLTLLW